MLQSCDRLKKKNKSIKHRKDIRDDRQSNKAASTRLQNGIILV